MVGPTMENIGKNIGNFVLVFFSYSFIYMKVSDLYRTGRTIKRIDQPSRDEQISRFVYLFLLCYLYQVTYVLGMSKRFVTYLRGLRLEHSPLVSLRV